MRRYKIQTKVYSKIVSLWCGSRNKFFIRMLPLLELMEKFPRNSLFVLPLCAIHDCEFMILRLSCWLLQPTGYFACGVLWIFCFGLNSYILLVNQQLWKIGPYLRMERFQFSSDLGGTLNFYSNSLELTYFPRNVTKFRIKHLPLIFKNKIKFRMSCHLYWKTTFL